MGSKTTKRSHVVEGGGDYYYALPPLVLEAAAELSDLEPMILFGLG